MPKGELKITWYGNSGELHSVNLQEGDFIESRKGRTYYIETIGEHDISFRQTNERGKLRTEGHSYVTAMFRHAVWKKV